MSSDQKGTAPANSFDDFAKKLSSLNRTDYVHSGAHMATWADDQSNVQAVGYFLDKPHENASSLSGALLSEPLRGKDALKVFNPPFCG